MTSDEHENIAIEDFDLMAWIASGTVATRTVTIYNDPAIAAEYEALEAERKAWEAEHPEPDGDAPMSSRGRPDFEAREADIYDRWQASKSTWTVRALSREEIEATFDEVPHPARPTPPPPKAGDRAGEKFSERMAAWGKRAMEADRERTLHLIAAAVTSVETVRGRVDSVTVEALRALRDRPHGEQWVGIVPSGAGQRVTGKLATAVMQATESDVEVPRPTSPERSTPTQG